MKRVSLSLASLTLRLEKGVFWKRGLFRKVHFLEILENLENPTISRDSRESRDFRDSRDSSKRPLS